MAKPVSRKTIFISALLVWSLLWLIAAVAPLVSPLRWWFPGFVAIGYWPLLFMGIGMLAWALLRRSRWGWLVLVLLAAGCWIITALWAPNSGVAFALQKNPETLRVMQFNARGLRGDDPTSDRLKPERKAFADELRRLQPDVICIEEFEDVRGPVVLSNTALLRDTLGYRYMQFQPTYYSSRPWGRHAFGTAIFSKYPIRQRGAMAIDSFHYPEKLVFADIDVQGRMIRVLAAHFQSMHLNWELLPDQLPPHLQQEGPFLDRAFFWQKLHFYQQWHVQQAGAILKFCDTTAVPIIFCTDMNTLPNSYVSRNFRQRFADAYLEKGWGLGATYNSYLPYVRIDYIFADTQLRVQQVRVNPLAISDHHSVVADIQVAQVLGK